MSTPSILVTGGAGYIGSHICYALKQSSYTPVTLDNLQHGHREAVKFGPLVEGDIGDVGLIKEICATYKPIAALHFAALIEVGESVRLPDLYRENNFTKAQGLFETLQSCGVDKVVFSSTAAVYGMPDREDTIAEDWPLKPINPYGQTKLDAENFLRTLPTVRSVALRYFNAAGANSEAGLGEAHWPETHLVPNALLALLGVKPEPLTIFGTDYPTPDGTAVRDYIHVADLADAHLRALDYLLKGGATTSINLGTGTGISVKSVLDTIAQVTGKSVPFTYGARRAGDPPFLVADNKQALKILSWQPKRSLTDIVASAYAWHSSATYKGLIKSLKSSVKGPA
jgi:UDP-glucose-4-epimerase GalE